MFDLVVLQTLRKEVFQQDMKLKKLKLNKVLRFLTAPLALLCHVVFLVSWCLGGKSFFTRKVSKK